MTRRRSKRKSTVLEGLTKAHGGLRRSKRKLAIREDEQKIYGDDYGILPSGKFAYFIACCIATHGQALMPSFAFFVARLI